MMKRFFEACLSSVAASLAGIVAALLVGVLWWPPGAGLTLIGIGLVTAGVLARMLAVRWHWPASVIASGLGAMVACFFAGATAEVLPPGSIEWMFKGGLYGACFGVPVAALLSPVGLAERRLITRSVRKRECDTH